jgi:TolB-like protein/DNA-binding winged helix-turn-helix (wHTH) protein/Tfp pilus assembly protein PilF
LSWKRSSLANCGVSLAAAVLHERSVSVNEPQETIYIADWEIHPETLRVSRGDDCVKLEPKVMQVLLYLAEKAGQVVSRQEIEEHVWRNQIVGYDAISRTIVNIRKALNDSSRDPRVIETIPKVGYRLIAEVRRSVADQSGNHSHMSPQGKRQSSRLRSTLVGILAVAVLAILWALIDGQGLVGRHGVDAARDGGETKPTIAVLPFRYLYSNPDNNYFSDGITADLITALSQVSGLQVISRDSAFAYRGGEINDAAIGEELGVRFLLKGNIQRDRDRIRLNVHLIEAQSGRSVWAERYDRLLTDIFKIQDELAERIVLALEVKLAPDERKRLIRNYLVSLDAYDAFLRGVDYYTKRSFADNQLAVDSFVKAIELDPGFARAYAGLALAYSWASGDTSIGSAEQAHKLASETVERAIQIDASIPQVYFVKGRIELYKKNYELAIQQIQKAIDIEPNYADAYALLASTLHFSGRPKDGLQAMRRAVLLNPRIPAAYLMIRGSLHYSSEEYDQAVEDLSRSLEINPNYLQSKVWLAATYAAQGRLEDAQWEVDEIRMLAPDIDFEWVERAYPIQDFHYKQRFRNDLKQAGVL